MPPLQSIPLTGPHRPKPSEFSNGEQDVREISINRRPARLGWFIDVFISDESEKSVAASGFKGTAILVAGGKSQRIVLAPVDGTRLSGSATAALPEKPKGVVQLTGPDGKTIQAKFD